MLVPPLTWSYPRARALQSELDVQIILSLLHHLPKVDKSTEPDAPAGDGGKAKALGEKAATTDNQCVEADLCTICLGGYEGEERLARLLPCTHSFHPECIEQWFRSGRSLDGACPICKQPMAPRGRGEGRRRGGRRGGDGDADGSIPAGMEMQVVVLRP
jgi:hypothetical protein